MKRRNILTTKYFYIKYHHSPNYWSHTDTYGSSNNQLIRAPNLVQSKKETHNQSLTTILQFLFYYFTWMSCLLCFISLCLFVFYIGNVNAAAIYTYTGNSYNESWGEYSSTMNITGSLTLDSELQSNLVNAEISVNDFSFSDGMYNINSNMETLTSVSFNFSTNSSGEIIDWSFYLFNAPFPMTSIGDYGHGIESFGLSNFDAAWVYKCKTLVIVEEGAPNTVI